MSTAAHPAAHDAGPYEPVFVGTARERVDQILGRYPTKQAALLPVLWLVQETRGWISDRNMAEVAELLSLTPAYVKGVVTFYTMFHQHPVGKHFVQVCTTSPCNVCGAEDVVRSLVPLFHYFKQDRQAGETLGDFCHRKGRDDLVAWSHRHENVPAA